MPIVERSQRLLSPEFRVQGTSMEPAYPSGAWVRINPFSYLLGLPRRGDVVGLRSPQDADRLELKRVVGLPGERIDWLGTTVRVNESEIYGGQSLVLGSGEYFVLGDNRLYSHDSRTYGAVKLTQILGKAV